MNERIKYSVFLIGDTGAMLTTVKDPVLQMLSAQLEEAGADSAVVFLGDNIYPNGMPEESDKARGRAEARINVQLNAVRGHRGPVYFISGNHDWNKGRAGGWEYLLREERYIRDQTGREDIFQPVRGCRGPVRIPLTDNITLIVINTQWWVQQGDKPRGPADGCPDLPQDFFAELDKALKEEKGKQILVAGHHPLYSNAIHGGKFHYKHHVFPLTIIRKKLYIPLPLIGSLYPMYRRYLGTKEDMAHPAYRFLRKHLLKVFRRHPGIIYASGHDHNLQYLKKGDLHFLISGSASKGAYVRKRKAIFADRRRGFIRLNFLDSGEVRLEGWVVPKGEDNGFRAYEGKLS